MKFMLRLFYCVSALSWSVLSEKVDSPKPGLATLLEDHLKTNQEFSFCSLHFLINGRPPLVSFNLCLLFKSSVSKKDYSYSWSVGSPTHSVVHQEHISSLWTFPKMKETVISIYYIFHYYWKILLLKFLRSKQWSPVYQICCQWQCLDFYIL